MQISKLKGLFQLLPWLTLQMLVMGLSIATETSDSHTSAPQPIIMERDIRVIIDVSGSMKKNDPANHRIKAVQLFSEILPSDLSAGIWTFAAKVNMLVKHNKVDKKWKASAFKKAKKIHSRGLYTNIEKALKVATLDLTKGQSNKEKHVILLTDGYVDISKNAAINADSRRRVINGLLPHLKKNNIIIHTIALSEHADHDLLKTLSHKTSGQYVVIENADDLERYFFKLFQSTTKPDTVPLKNNSFDIDNSVNDMTVVLFNSDYASELSTPSNEKWSSDNHPSNVKWVKSDNYEIITVSKPAVGTWTVNAPIDPDNRVMIVTNLRLHVNKLPSLLLPNETLQIEAFLTENGKVIKKEEFINLLYMKSVIKKKDSLRRIILDLSHTGDGVFSTNADVSILEGQSVLSVTVKSPTFVREYKHTFSVIAYPVIVESEIVNNESFMLTANIDDRVIDKNNVSITLDDEQESQSLQYTNYHWQLKLPKSYSGKKISVVVEATLHNNKSFKQTITHTLPEIIKPKPADPHKENEEKHDTEEKHKTEENISKKQEPEKHSETDKKDEHSTDNEEAEHADEGDGSLNWIIVTIAVLLINIILGVVGYFLYKKIFKSDDDDFLLLDQTDLSTNNADDSTNSSKEEIAGLEDLEDMDDIESIDSNK